MQPPDGPCSTALCRVHTKDGIGPCHWPGASRQTTRIGDSGPLPNGGCWAVGCQLAGSLPQQGAHKNLQPALSRDQGQTTGTCGQTLGHRRNVRRHRTSGSGICRLQSGGLLHAAPCTPTEMSVLRHIWPDFLNKMGRMQHAEPSNKPWSAPGVGRGRQRSALLLHRSGVPPPPPPVSSER